MTVPVFAPAGGPGPEMLFEHYVEAYFTDMAPRLRPTTVGKKRAMIRRWILPEFQGRRLMDITSLDVMRWQNRLLGHRNPETGKALKPSYLLTLHKELRALMRHAEKFYSLRKNPMDHVRPIGTFADLDMHIWSMEEYLRFAGNVQDPMLHTCFELLYWCGLRRGELLALTREDFDLEAETVKISKTLVLVEGKPVPGPPKDDSSYRTVQMPDFLAEEVRSYLQTCNREPGARVFPVSPGTLLARFREATAAAGLPRIRLHDLRHSHVSLLIHLGFTAVAIARRMGHESIEITYSYSHLFPGDQEELAMALEQLRKGGEESRYAIKA